jgi:antitoxin ParD1/3/4
MIYRSITFIHLFGISLRERTMKLITLYLPETYIKALDQLVTECFYPNRAEAIRVAIRDLISAEVWRRKDVD